jgi:electron transfer flavoprotein beta subunit
MTKSDGMKILACVKQVPDAEGVFRPDAEGRMLDGTGLVHRMNEYDLYAVEEAVRWRERYGAETITALSVGPERVLPVVRRALEFGIDHGVHLRTGEEDPTDALETASRIAAYARTHDFRLLLFGVMSEDLQRCQTGPMTAALLGLPYASAAISAECSADGSRVLVEQEMEAGRREILDLPLPALLAVQPGINIPRYPSLSHKLRARKQELEIVPCEKPATEKSRVRRLCLKEPPPARPGVFLTGTPVEKAEKLVRFIRERTGLL